ncbi:MAG: putative glycosyltransferase [Proteobacteria bacterium]|nr:putative glycosyltransferase [Pseudomonadota bacterium]
MNYRSFKPLTGPALMLAVLTAAALTTRPLLPIDETRYVGVAWEMWHGGDYLVMFKNGEPYSHKPPMLFWLCNLGWAVFGVSEWWPRLVSPLFSIGGLWLTGSIAGRLWPDDENARRNALWILASSLMWMVFSTTVMFDVMLAFFVLLGVRGLLVSADGRAGRGFLLYGLAVGLGVLGKGPVVLLHLLPMALAVPWWRPGINWRRWYCGVALAVMGGALMALAWAVPAAIRGGEEYRNAIFWGSAISGKQLHYLVPLFPAFALMAGRALSQTERSTIWVPVLLFCVLGAAMVYFSLAGLPGKARSWEGVPSWPGVVLMVTALLAGVLSKRQQRCMPVLAGLNGTAFFLVQMYVAHNVWAHYDVSPMADAIKRMQDRGVSVAIVGRYHDQYQFAGRLEHPVTVLAEDRVRAWLDENPDGGLVTDVDPDDLKSESPQIDSLFSQPLRGKIALLLSSGQAKALPTLWRGGFGNSLQDAD